MHTYVNASDLAYRGYAKVSMPIDDAGNVEDPDFFKRHPALEEIYTLHVAAGWAHRKLDQIQTDLVGPFDWGLPEHYGPPSF